MTDLSTSTITGYHAHVYYDAETKAMAAELRDAVERAFEVRLGSWHDSPVGPHPRGSYQIAFGPELFGELIPWLALNRRGLVVFVHPETGDVLADHDERALWLGQSERLNMAALQ